MGFQGKCWNIFLVKIVSQSLLNDSEKKKWRQNLKRIHNLHSLDDVYNMYVWSVLGMKSLMFLRNAITSLMRMQSFVILVWDFFSSELFSAFDTKKNNKIIYSNSKSKYHMPWKIQQQKTT